MNGNLKGRSGVTPVIQGAARRLTRRLAVHENVTYGQSLRVGRGCVISSPHGLEIGHSVSIGPRSIIQVDGVIGDFALIGMGVQIVGRQDHAIDEVGRPIVFSTWAGDRPADEDDRVDIGRDVWIGGSSVILSRVRIGEGAVIGSGSVVTRDIPEYSVAAGNPARVIKSRFTSATDVERHREALAEMCATFSLRAT